MPSVGVAICYLRQRYSRLLKVTIHCQIVKEQILCAIVVACLLDFWVSLEVYIEKKYLRCITSFNRCLL